MGWEGGGTPRQAGGVPCGLARSQRRTPTTHRPPPPPTDDTAHPVATRCHRRGVHAGLLCGRLGAVTCWLAGWSGSGARLRLRPPPAGVGSAGCASCRAVVPVASGPASSSCTPPWPGRSAGSGPHGWLGAARGVPGGRAVLAVVVDRSSSSCGGAPRQVRSRSAWRHHGVGLPSPLRCCPSPVTAGRPGPGRRRGRSSSRSVVSVASRPVRAARRPARPCRASWLRSCRVVRRPFRVGRPRRRPVRRRLGRGGHRSCGAGVSSRPSSGAAARASSSQRGCRPPDAPPPCRAEAPIPPSRSGPGRRAPSSVSGFAPPTAPPPVGQGGSSWGTSLSASASPPSDSAPRPAGRPARPCRSG